jgi:CubicO group peptidase (beta-lactamase class C family)
LENIIAQSFESFADDNILGPLGMKNTGYNFTEEVINNMARGYPAPLLNLGWEAAAGNHGYCPVLPYRRHVLYRQRFG